MNKKGWMKKKENWKWTTTWSINKHFQLQLVAEKKIRKEKWKEKKRNKMMVSSEMMGSPRSGLAQFHFHSDGWVAVTVMLFLTGSPLSTSRFRKPTPLSSPHECSAFHLNPPLGLGRSSSPAAAPATTGAERRWRRSSAPRRTRGRRPPSRTPPSESVANLLPLLSCSNCIDPWLLGNLTPFWSGPQCGISADKQAGRDGGREDQEAGRGAGQVQGADPQDPPRPVPGGHQGARHPTPQAQAHVCTLTAFVTLVMDSLPMSPPSIPVPYLLPYCSYYYASGIKQLQWHWDRSSSKQPLFICIDLTLPICLLGMRSNATCCTTKLTI